MTVRPFPNLTSASRGVGEEFFLGESVFARKLGGVIADEEAVPCPLHDFAGHGGGMFESFETGDAGPERGRGPGSHDPGLFCLWRPSQQISDNQKRHAAAPRFGCYGVQFTRQVRRICEVIAPTHPAEAGGARAEAMALARTST